MLGPIKKNRYCAHSHYSLFQNSSFQYRTTMQKNQGNQGNQELMVWEKFIKEPIEERVKHFGKYYDQIKDSLELYLTMKYPTGVASKKEELRNALEGTLEDIVLKCEKMEVSFEEPFMTPESKSDDESYRSYETEIGHKRKAHDDSCLISSKKTASNIDPTSMNALASVDNETQLFGAEISVACVDKEHRISKTETDPSALPSAHDDSCLISSKKTASNIDATSMNALASVDNETQLFGAGISVACVDKEHRISKTETDPSALPSDVLVKQSAWGSSSLPSLENAERLDAMSADDILTKPKEGVVRWENVPLLKETPREPISGDEDSLSDVEYSVKDETMELALVAEDKFLNPANSYVTKVEKLLTHLGNRKFDDKFRFKCFISIVSALKIPHKLRNKLFHLGSYSKSS